MDDFTNFWLPSALRFLLTNLHRLHGCFPSKVFPMAMVIPSLCEYETNIPIQAAHCKITKCPPIAIISRDAAKTL